MRSSIVGALGSWTAYAAVRTLWPRPGAVMIVLVLCTFFTLLTTAHLMARMVRVVIAVRAVERKAAWKQSRVGSTLTRRELLWTACQAALAFAFVAVFRRTPAFGQVACAGAHPHRFTTSVTHEDEVIARRNLERSMILICDNECARFNCATGRCRANRVAIANPGVKCRFNKKQGTFACQADVVQCVCDCFACEGEKTLTAPFNEGIGVANTQAEAQTAAAADARSLCDEFCGHFLCPTPPDPVPPCRVDVFAAGGVGCSQPDRKTGKITCRQQITTCRCRCGT